MSRHPERSAVRRPREARTIGLAAATVSAVLVLAGCGVLGPSATPSISPTPGGTPSVSASPAPTSTANAGPGLVPEGTAGDNLPLFAEVTATVWASGDRVSGRAYVDALVAAGFDKSAMQVTQDNTTVGNPAESIQFSVRWGEECLIGQVGPATGDPITVVAPGLAEGMCLVGDTRPIDW